jgi:hypothetical protein
MKKTFLKSVATGIVGLTLVTSCSVFNKESAHKCSSNSCTAKADSATKDGNHSCNGKKAKKAAKTAPKATPKAEVKTDAKVETKTTDKK